jgi:integrase
MPIDPWNPSNRRRNLARSASDPTNRSGGTVSKIDNVGSVASHDHEHVFIGRDGGLLRRSSFHRRTWRPALNGNPANDIASILPGIHFHDVRHTHKTWLIEDEVPEAAQAKRLGHRLPCIRGIYSHVSATVEKRLVDGLQRRWSKTAPHADSSTGDNL